jgi:hypothetical protein
VTSQSLPAKLLSLEKGTGVEDARRVSRWLSVGGLVTCMAVCLFATLVFGPWSMTVVMPSVVVGWMVSERNAVDSRIQQWPTMRRYINWKAVEADVLSETERLTSI